MYSELTWGPFEEAVGLVIMGSHHSLQYLDSVKMNWYINLKPKNHEILFHN